MEKLFSSKIPFISFYCLTNFFTNLICLPFFHSTLSHFSFEHQSPAHKHHLKPGLTFVSLLHPQNMLPHTEVFYSSVLFTWTFLFSVSWQICSFFFSSGTQSHISFLIPQGFVWNIAGFWETIHITNNTAEICWQGWNYVEISLKKQ